MQKSYFDHHSWFFVPLRPGLVTTLRKCNVVAIWILALIVLGVLVSAFTPQPIPANAARHQAAPGTGVKAVAVHHS